MLLLKSKTLASFTQKQVGGADAGSRARGEAGKSIKDYSNNSRLQ